MSPGVLSSVESTGVPDGASAAISPEPGSASSSALDDSPGTSPAKLGTSAAAPSGDASPQATTQLESKLTSAESPRVREHDFLI
jgi:hypothetical protein